MKDKNINSNLFINLDKKRYQSHQRGFYPEDNEYSKKTKVTSYKKKIY